MAEFDFEPAPEQLSLEEAAQKLRHIQAGLRVVVANLHERLVFLDSEPGWAALRKDVESRAADLESEVRRLRADLKSAKDQLGSDAEKKKLP